MITNLGNYYFLWGRGSYQIQKAKKIAKEISNEVTSPRFQLTGFPDQYSDSTYRYFLELADKRPIEKNSLEHGDELFVICESECKPIGAPQWDIAYFAPKKVAKKWDSENVRIYKLTR